MDKLMDKSFWSLNSLINFVNYFRLGEEKNK